MAGFDHKVGIIFLGDFLVNKGTLFRALREVPEGPDVKCLKPGNGMLEMLFVRDGKRVRVKLSHTGGQERYRSITSSFYRGVHGCLLLFDVTQKSTFDSLHEWQRELSSNTVKDDVVIALGGCNAHVTGNHRQVARRSAQDFATFLGAPYHELSITNVATIVDALRDLVDRILLKASRAPEFSTTIMPLERRLQTMKEGKGKKGACGC